MWIPAGVRMEMAQNLMNALPLIGGGQRFELTIGKLEVQQVVSAFVGTWRLGRTPDVDPGKKIRESGMMLPITANGGYPTWSGKKGVALQRRTAKEQVVATTRAHRQTVLLIATQTVPLSDRFKTLQPGFVSLPIGAGRKIDLQDAWISGKGDF